MRKCDVTSMRAEYLDCCISGYFQGSSADEVLAVPVLHDTTYKQAYEACKDDFNVQSGYFDDVAGSGGMADEALHAMFAKMLIEDPNKVADFVSGIEAVTENDEAESVYLYVGLFAEEN